MPAIIREFRSEDSAAVNCVALSAWEQYCGVFSDWARSEAIFAHAATLSSSAQLLVAEALGSIIGCVVYVAPWREREEIYDPSWSIIRMLSVGPAARGQGIGRQLSEAWIVRARRDGASVIALHTSPVMTVALTMYLRLGFVHHRDIAHRNGLPYAVYTLGL